MRSRRLGSVLTVVGLTLGMVTTGVAFAGGNPDTDFSKLKPIKEPASCKDGDGISADTIKVGVISPTSGPQAQSYAPSTEQGIEARIEQANTSGELGNRTIEIVKKDDQGSQANNLTAAQQLVEEEGVFGIIELSPAADGSAQYLYDEKIPVGGWHNGLKEWGTYPNMFSWRNTVPPEPENTFTGRAGDVMKELGAKKIAIVGTNLAASAVFVDQTTQAIGKTKGLEVVYETTDITPEQQDFTGIADQIKQSGADGVYTGLAGLQANGLSQAIKQAGVDLNAIVFPGGYDDRVLTLPGYEGAYLGTEFKPLEIGSPGLTAYEEAMAAVGAEPQRFFGLQGYFGADVFVNGLKAAGVDCPTRKAFINNLRLEKGYDADGAFVPVDYAEIFGRPFYCVYYVQIQNQEFVPVNDGEPICATRIFEDGKGKKLSKAEQAKG
jgi:ABC-type branched-subunit amino acid transport system substrate-binding protein